MEREWTLKYSVGGAADSTLQDPLLVETNDSLVVVYDNGQKAILTFNAVGEVVWKFGREGQGPGEFRKIRDVAFDDEGAVYTLDSGNGRIYRIVRGQVVRSMRIPAVGLPLGLVAGSDVSRVLVMAAQPLVTVDSTGEVISREGLPHRDADIHPLATQAFIAGTPDRWALAFIFGGGWIGAPVGELKDSFQRSIVADPGFPIVETRGRFDARLSDSRPIIRSVSVVDGIVYLHAVAGEEGFVDRFSLNDGTYLGSWRLPPEVTHSFASSISKTFIVFLRADPVPTLLAYASLE